MAAVPTYLSVKVRFSSHAMMGRLRRSLYVGRMTEYLSLVALGAIAACAADSCILVVDGMCGARGGLNQARCAGVERAARSVESWLRRRVDGLGRRWARWWWSLASSTWSLSGQLADPRSVQGQLAFEQSLGDD